MDSVALTIDMSTVKGFLDEEEAHALYSAALSSANLGPILEIGSYCGKSTIYLGQAAKQTGNTVFAVDHHSGSEEHQLGEEYFDSALFDHEHQRVDTFGEFRANIRSAHLDDCIVPIVAPTLVASKHWATPLGMVFIDGGHSYEAALNDYQCWTPFIKKGGILAIHDIFPNPEDGGRPPFEIYNLALASGQFELISMTKTLGLLKRL